MTFSLPSRLAVRLRPPRGALRVLALATSALLLTAAGAELASTSSCTAAATNNPLRSFDNAQNVDVVCMQTLTTEDGGAVNPVPLPQAACTPVPSGVTGSILPNHLFALVTQTARGEVGVVDLTAGVVIDEDLGSPGINFLPVGANPTGIASAPDGKMTFVAAADTNKPAIYGLPSTLILGNSQQLEGGRSPTPPLLTTWPVCALSQPPTAVSVIPSAPPEPTADGGGGDAGAAGEAGASNGFAAGYVLAVVIAPELGGQAARVLVVDPGPLLRGGGISIDGGGPTDPPGQLTPCTILGELPLSAAVPDAGAGPVAADGVKWIDGGVEASVPSGAACTSTGTGSGVGGVDAGSIAPPAPLAANVARADQFLYVADQTLPIIHVFDLRVPSSPRELAPLRATSLASSRSVTVGALAISPVTRDYQRFLYAVDTGDVHPSIMVFDVTDPIASPHVPLRRPHSNLVPLQSEDRISFGAGVTTLAFVQHDWPLAQTAGGGLVSGAASTGLLCNPNPNVDIGGLDASADAQQFTDPGANYRASSLPFADEPLGPSRLRGIFAFATLSNGQVVTIDVDDWDAPCRRPVTMGPVTFDGGQTSGYTSAIAPPEPNAVSSTDPLDPYEAPFTGVTNGTNWVTDEAFFPVSEPHRPRSTFPLSNDPSQGIHFPYLAGVPQLYSAGPDGGLGASASASIQAGNPVLLPTQTQYPDPSILADGGVGIRIAFEDPLAHIDQAWTVDYEGQLPGFAPSQSADINVPGQGPTLGAATQQPPYYTLFFSNPGAGECGYGVEDWDVGQQRVATFVAASKAANLPVPESMNLWVGDYVQVADALLPQGDPYWSSDPQANEPNDCWAGWTNADGTTAPPLTDPTQRYNTCENIFGDPSAELVTRDFPIVQAFDDGFVVTRFNYPQNKQYPVVPTTQNRQITPPDVSNVTALEQLRCCFHRHVSFNVRAGGEWVTTGSASGFLHHVTVDPATQRCVTACDPQKALLNGRNFGVPPAVNGDAGPTPAPGRDSPLAMRNPSFAFYIEHPFTADPNVSPQQPAPDGGVKQVVGRPARDFVWQFALKGELQPLTINLAATNNTVSPKSMLFIPSLGQLAIVDGSQTGQGLILIDLNSVQVTGNSYY